MQLHVGSFIAKTERERRWGRERIESALRVCNCSDIITNVNEVTPGDLRGQALGPRSFRGPEPKQKTAHIA